MLRERALHVASKRSPDVHADAPTAGQEPLGLEPGGAGQIALYPP